MRYEMISADCHLDLCWLPTDLFVTQASAEMRDRMPYVEDGPKGKRWLTKKGANLGLVNGMGSAGREYVPGRIHRADRMAATGLYEDGKKGIRRLSDPDLRIKDQDRDGVQAEVLYGILGATGRMNDPDATVEVMRIYNEWLADFCSTHPERYAGLASIPNNPLEAAITEIERVAKRGALRGLDIANSPDLKPLWDPYWNPLWEVVNASGLPLHFHTVGGYVPDHIRKIVFVGSDPSRAALPDAPAVELPVARAAFATSITQFQVNMANILASVIFSGALERYRGLRLVLGESGIGWIPYILWRMDAEWEDQFRDLSSSTSWAPTASCGARTSRIPTASGRIRASTCSARWGTSPPTCDARSSARTPRGSTASSWEDARDEEDLAAVHGLRWPVARRADRHREEG